MCNSMCRLKCQTGISNHHSNSPSSISLHHSYTGCTFIRSPSCSFQPLSWSISLISFYLSTTYKYLQNL